MSRIMINWIEPFQNEKFNRYTKRLAKDLPEDIIYFERNKKVILKSFFTFKGYTDKGINVI